MAFGIMLSGEAVVRADQAAVRRAAEAAAKVLMDAGIDAVAVVRLQGVEEAVTWTTPARR